MLKVRTATANGTPERFTLSPSGGPAARSGARREDPQVLDGPSLSSTRYRMFIADPPGVEGNNESCEL
jgi:hypothetical protein